MWTQELDHMRRPKLGNGLCEGVYGFSGLSNNFWDLAYFRIQNISLILQWDKCCLLCVNVDDSTQIIYEKNLLL
jgi:hypothetical protein